MVSNRNPWYFQDLVEEMDRMTRDFSRVFDAPGCLMDGPETGLRIAKDVATVESGVEPLADVYRDENGVRLLVDLPGATDKDLELQVHDGVLSLKARVERAENLARVYSRAFRVDRRIDLDKIEARISQGVLSLTLPFRAEAQPKRIEVKTA